MFGVQWRTKAQSQILGAIISILVFISLFSILGVLELRRQKYISDLIERLELESLRAREHIMILPYLNDSTLYINITGLSGIPVNVKYIIVRNMTSSVVNVLNINKVVDPGGSISIKYQKFTHGKLDIIVVTDRGSIFRYDPTADRRVKSEDPYLDPEDLKYNATSTETDKALAISILKDVLGPSVLDLLADYSIVDWERVDVVTPFHVYSYAYADLGDAYTIIKLVKNGTVIHVEEDSYHNEGNGWACSRSPESGVYEYQDEEVKTLLKIEYHISQYAYAYYRSGYGVDEAEAQATLTLYITTNKPPILIVVTKSDLESLTWHSGNNMTLSNNGEYYYTIIDGEQTKTFYIKFGGKVRKRYEYGASAKVDIPSNQHIKLYIFYLSPRG